MDASEWKYVGEGGKHALFSYHPMTNGCDDWKGKLLRVSKGYLASASTWSPDNLLTSKREQPNDVLVYIRTVVAPSLAPYVDVPGIVLLCWSFLNQLRRLTISEGCIPDSRKADWSLPASDKKIHDFLEHPSGTLVHDYRKLTTSPDLSSERLSSERCICIEIKPKAGYCAFSPLVDPSHRIKFRTSRFVLLQKLHQRGHVAKAWTTESESIQLSDYDPIDLFSSNKSRIHKAISNLLACPQNNLRIWYNDSLLVGHSVCKEESDILLHEIESLFASSHSESPRCIFESFIKDILLSILSHENLLPRLLRLQELDVLDTDGAIHVYERLVQLCGGSRTEAEAKIDDASIRERAQKEDYGILDKSPFAINGDSTNILSLCKRICEFRHLLNTVAPALPPASQLDDFRKWAIGKVESFSVEECQFVLANWLLGLAMCDVSIFITLQQTQNAMENQKHETVNHCQREGTPHVNISRGNDKDPGRISWTADGRKLSFVYNVRLIDVDRKPAEKLRGRQEKETAFRNLD
jgi:inositol-pentakisphosphate 2-kinase